MPKDRLTLSEAIAKGELDAFIAQGEADGIGPVDADDLDKALRQVITSPSKSRPASLSHDRGGSRGK